MATQFTSHVAWVTFLCNVVKYRMISQQTLKHVGRSGCGTTWGNIREFAYSDREFSNNLNVTRLWEVLLL